MRIAVAGLHTECSTYNPVLAREADFRVLRGPSMLKDAYFDFLTHFPAEFITMLHARAIAGGPVERGIYDRVEGGNPRRASGRRCRSMASISPCMAPCSSRACTMPRAISSPPCATWSGRMC